MAKENNALPIGYRLEEYRIEAVLGAGGFGITYKAFDTHLETWVAIKEYFPVEWSYRSRDGVQVMANIQGQEATENAEASGYNWGLNRFLDEARVLARVKHDYVVRVTRYFKANGSAYIVMEYEDGEPLSAVLQRRGTLKENELRSLLDEILPALQAVHAYGYLHRDLKPSNLYVRARDGSVMLIDFGAARQALGRRSKSLTGLVTPGYSPPEQYATRSDRYGPWTDIYSLGAVLYRCVTGEAPVEAPDRQMWDTLVPAVEAGSGRYKENLLRIVDHALAMRPEDRFRSVAEMWAMLKDNKKVVGANSLSLTPIAPDDEPATLPDDFPKSKRPLPFPDSKKESAKADAIEAFELSQPPASMPVSQIPVSKVPVSRVPDSTAARGTRSRLTRPTTEQIQLTMRPRAQQQRQRLVYAVVALLVVLLGTAGFIIDRAQRQKNAQTEALKAEKERERAEQEAQIRRAEIARQFQLARTAISELDWQRAETAIEQVGELLAEGPSLRAQREDLKAVQAELAEARRLPYPQMVRTEPITGMELVLIERACYEMGSPPDEPGRYINETGHAVCVEPFWLSRHEVTNAQYRLFKPEHDSGTFKDQSLNGDRQPVTGVSWRDATAYAAWLSRRTGERFRLPTEAEWEYAARSGKQTARYWGDDPAKACRYANVNDLTSRRENGFDWDYFPCDDKRAVTAAVGAYEPNSLTLYDMLGNVREWTCSAYDPNYAGVEQRCASSTATTGRRVHRGGSWDAAPNFVRAADRTGEDLNLRGDNLGFRLAQEK